MTYTDDDLIAFLNGEADETLATGIEEAIAADPTLEDRLMALDPGIGAAEEAFEELKGPKEGAISLPPSQSADSSPGVIRKVLPLAAAALVGAFLVSGFLEPPEDDTNWRVQVANYQALYSADTVGSTSFSNVDLEIQTSLAAERIGLPDLILALQATQGLTHVRTQTLQVNGTPLAQVVFKTADGVPVALCGIARTEGSASAEIGFGRMAKMQSASFETNGHSWLLVGGKDADLILENAKQFRDALNELPIG